MPLKSPKEKTPSRLVHHYLGQTNPERVPNNLALLIDPRFSLVVLVAQRLVLDHLQGTPNSSPKGRRGRRGKSNGQVKRVLL